MTQRFARPQRAVVKVGSSSLRGVDGRLDTAQVTNLATQICAARARGTQVVLVSSGAVAAGMGLLGMTRRPHDVATLQAAAAVGQSEVIQTYQRAFALDNTTAGQVLLGQDDFTRRNRYLNAKQSLLRLLELGAVPIINENDAIATDELTYGDNDHLAALVTTMLDADLLVLLSDVDGLFDGDPRRPGAQLINQVDDVAALDAATIGGTGSFVGSGGMQTKVSSATVAVSSGRHAVIANARRPEVIRDVLAGEPVGTWFVAQSRHTEARRLWIAFALAPRGQITIDDGAVVALTTRGSSLLSVGVKAVAGGFVSGDAVEIVTVDDTVVARGIVAYDAGDLEKICGMSTDDAAQIFGAGFAREVIHRDDLVLTQLT
ncbi:MAG: glutamate 5-kinase [Nitriliruptoraceae bacterium]